MYPPHPTILQGRPLSRVMTFAETVNSLIQCNSLQLLRHSLTFDDFIASGPGSFCPFPSTIINPKVFDLLDEISTSMTPN